MENQEAAKQFRLLTDGFKREKAHLYYQPISVQQKRSAVDFPARGTAWASRTTFPAPQDSSITQAVQQAIATLGSGGELVEPFEQADVKVQWSGHRPGVADKEPEPDISEAEKYRRLTECSSSDVTLLYFHGGFYYTGSAATSRNVTSSLANLTCGRCVVPEFRLCPQHPFPAALIDGLVTYLTMLYPPAGSLHRLVSARHIVVVGESSGATISLQLLLLIREIQRNQQGCVRFWGKEVQVPMPGGIATIGAQTDLTYSFPPDELNAAHDFQLPIPPCLDDRMPRCAVWPSQPPRGDMYCETSALCHPLVSPAASGSWDGMPPMYFAYGQEYSAPEGAFIARQASENSIPVEFHHYERLPHIFPFILPKLLQSRHVLQEIARFCTACVGRPQSLVTKNLRYPAAVNDILSVDAGPFANLEPDYVLQRMRDKRAERKIWTGLRETASL